MEPTWDGPKTRVTWGSPPITSLEFGRKSGVLGLEDRRWGLAEMGGVIEAEPLWGWAEPKDPRLEM